MGKNILDAILLIFVISSMANADPSDFLFQMAQSSVHCIRFGSGPQLLICFHGFDETAEKFRSLEPALGKRYSVVAVDLPFHGKTNWQAGTFFTPENLKMLINYILEQEMKHRFSLMGYSLGGKIALAAVTQFASAIDEIILVAPDGVKSNAWYNVAVYPGWGQKLFKRFVKNPTFIFHTANILKWMGILSERFHKFLQFQTDTETKRQKVYDVWISIRELEPELTKVKLLLNQCAIKSYIFIGKYDRVITPRIGKLFAKGLKQCTYIVLDKGHNLITESLNEPLMLALQ